MEWLFCIYFLPFQYIGACSAKCIPRRVGSSGNSTPVHNSAMVHKATESGVCTVISSTSCSGNSCVRQESIRSPVDKDDVGSISHIRESLISAGIPEHTASIILTSWRCNTKKQYGTYFKKWCNFCSGKQIDYFTHLWMISLNFLHIYILKV